MMDKVIDNLLLAIGLLGGLLCVAGIVTLGFDINRFLNTGAYHFSTTGVVLSQTLPGLWFKIVQFSRWLGEGNPLLMVLNFIFDASAMLVFLVVGGAAMFFGFRMRRYRL